MSLKQEIETWVQALAHYDNNEFEESLTSFDAIPDTSKILFNCGVIHATLGEHGKAVEYYQRAVRLDQYLAVAYFQQGVSNFLVGDFEEALANFNDALIYLRGNTWIDYEQLGLKFKLYSCEVLFNRGLCYIYLQQKDAGLQDFSYAVKEKVVDDHNVIDEAIKEEAEGYTVFSIPVGVVFRPNEAKVKNLKTKDYLGKARLVAASDRNNAFTGFTGSEVKKNLAREDSSRDDRPLDNISFAATNLVKPGLSSRARQQSEPPINRNMFPPTPPPESDKSAPLLERRRSSGGTLAGMTGRAASVRSGTGKPDTLDIAKAGLEKGTRERPRLGTIRTASEPRGPSRSYSFRNGDCEAPTRNRILRQTPLRRRVTSDEEEADDEYPSELYDMYRNPRSSNGMRRATSRTQRPRFIEEEEEEQEEQQEGGDDDATDVHANSSLDEEDFEIVSGSQAARRRASRSRAASRKPEIRKLRVKVHAEDTRYIMIGASIDFADLMDRIREKFGLLHRFKCQISDDGDMITMADQDDLDMAMMTSKSNAKREGGEMGKMELWVQEVV
ncbi:MAG: hypothetical protein M1827_005898 [Pycnora praestabilis]|nr:MAG: hypothetical protein M1827_005898 [Pycnora praestabilis]